MRQVHRAAATIPKLRTLLHVWTRPPRGALYRSCLLPGSLASHIACGSNVCPFCRAMIVSPRV